VYVIPEGIKNTGFNQNDRQQPYYLAYRLKVKCMDPMIWTEVLSWKQASLKDCTSRKKIYLKNKEIVKFLIGKWQVIHRDVLDDSLHIFLKNCDM